MQKSARSKSVVSITLLLRVGFCTENLCRAAISLQIFLTKPPQVEFGKPLADNFAHVVARACAASRVVNNLLYFVEGKTERLRLSNKCEPFKHAFVIKPITALRTRRFAEKPAALIKTQSFDADARCLRNFADFQSRARRKCSFNFNLPSCRVRHF